MKRVPALAFVLLMAIGLTACVDLSAKLQAELDGRAESGVAIAIDYSLAHVQRMLDTHDSVADISEEELAGAFSNDLTDTDLTGATPPAFESGQRQAIYHLVEIADGVRFHVFFRSSTSGASGPIPGSAHRHTCGVIIGAFGSDSLTVRDEECPPALQGWEDAAFDVVSMVELVRKYGLDAETLE